MRLSLCVTHFERFDMLIRCFHDLLEDERIDDVVISDDCSKDGSVERLIEYYKEYPKVRVIIQAENRGMAYNKYSAVSFAKNEWVILFDCDNVIDRSYIDALEKVGELSEDTIYQPEKGEPNFDWSLNAGKVITSENISPLMEDALFRSCLNGANYVVHRDQYCMHFVHAPEIDAADTIKHLYLWLWAGNKFYITPQMTYIHTVHPESGFLKNVHKNMSDAIFYENKIRELK